MWKYNVRSKIQYGLIMQIHMEQDKETLPEFVDLLTGKLGRGETDNSWRAFPIVLGNEKLGYEKFRLCVYRKRMILYRDSTMKSIGCEDLDAGIRYIVRRAGAWQQSVAELFDGAGVIIRGIPFLFTSNISYKSDNFINEGITSFNYRLHNSKSGKLGVLRISRHILICCGLNTFIEQEAINSCYENLLIKKEGKIDSDDVFKFMESLNRFAVSGEENSFLQILAIKITIIFAVFTSAAQIVDYLTADTRFKIIAQIVLLLLIYPAFRLMNWLFSLRER